jgi:hypothetical protein
MNNRIRITSTAGKAGIQPDQRGYGFFIEQLGSGPQAGEYLPALEIFYETEGDAIEAEAAIRLALNKARNVQGFKYG